MRSSLRSVPVIVHHGKRLGLIPKHIVASK
jgi:hypothetical protein